MPRKHKQNSCYGYRKKGYRPGGRYTCKREPGLVLPRLFEARGATVKGLGTRTGRRREHNLAPLPRGGCRKKKETMKKSGNILMQKVRLMNYLGNIKIK